MSDKKDVISATKCKRGQPERLGIGGFQRLEGDATDIRLILFVAKVAYTFASAFAAFMAAFSLSCVHFGGDRQPCLAAVRLHGAA